MRRFMKRLGFTLCVPLALPLVILSRLELLLIGDESTYQASATALGLIPGFLGRFVRLAFYRLTLRRCSLDVSFDFGSTVSHSTAEIGSNVSIGAHSCIGTATIANDVSIGPRVSVLSGVHQHDRWDGETAINDGATRLERIRIGAHTWIGDGAIIGADVGARCVVAAGAVLLRASSDDKTLMGNPARAVSPRFSKGFVETSRSQ